MHVLETESTQQNNSHVQNPQQKHGCSPKCKHLPFLDIPASLHQELSRLHEQGELQAKLLAMARTQLHPGLSSGVSLAGSFMWLRIQEKYMQRTREQQLYLCLIHTPAKGLSFEQSSNAPPAYDILQQDLADLHAPDVLAIMAGDFNASTGLATGTCQDDFSDVLDASVQPQPGSYQPLPSRKSADTQFCAFGRYSLALSEASDQHMLNRSTAGDADGHFTCYMAQGSSVVDYILASLPLLTSTVSMTVSAK